LYSFKNKLKCFGFFFTNYAFAIRIVDHKMENMMMTIDGEKPASIAKGRDELFAAACCLLLFVSHKREC